MERLGIFGGTFDPPHIGHLILASEAACQLKLDRVFWILTPNPPHQPGQVITPVADRIEMVNAAIHGNPLFTLHDVDLQRSPPHYAVDTIKILRDQINDEDEFVYLIGGDSLENLPKWHKPDLLIQSVNLFGVLRRPGVTFNLSSLEMSLPGLLQKIGWIEAPLVDISSSRIRLLVKDNGPFRYYVPEGVYNYICKHKLYQFPA